MREAKLLALRARSSIGSCCFARASLNANVGRAAIILFATAAESGTKSAHGAELGRVKVARVRARVP